MECLNGAHSIDSLNQKKSCHEKLKKNLLLTQDGVSGGGGFNTFGFLSFLLAAFNAVR